MSWMSMDRMASGPGGINEEAMTKWKPANKKPPMLGNGNSLGGYQLGIVWVPLLATAGRFLIPLAVGTGAYFAFTGEDEKGDKTTLGISNRKIAYSALAGGIGAAAFLGSSILPENVRPIGTVVGAIGTAAAIAILFWPDPKKLPERAIVKDGSVPIDQELPRNTASAVLNNTFKLRMPEEQSLTTGKVRSVHKPQEYEFEVTNYSGKPLSAIFGAKITDPTTTSLIHRTPATDEPSYGRRAYTVPPDNMPHTYKVKVPDLDIPLEWWGQYFSGRVVDVGIEVFRNLSDDKSFFESNPIAIRYAQTGIELGSTQSVAPVQVALHDERDPNHVIGCAKCKKKRRAPENGQWPFQENPPSSLV